VGVLLAGLRVPSGSRSLPDETGLQRGLDRYSRVDEMRRGAARRGNPDDGGLVGERDFREA
jgi:hypothetical protein